MVCRKVVLFVALAAVFSVVDSTPQGLGGLSKSRQSCQNKEDDALTLTLALPLHNKQCCKEKPTEAISRPRFIPRPRILAQPHIIPQPHFIHAQPQYIAQPQIIHHHQQIIAQPHIIEQEEVCAPTHEIISQQQHIIAQPQIISQPIHGQSVCSSCGLGSCNCNKAIVV